MNTQYVPLPILLLGLTPFITFLTLSHSPPLFRHLSGFFSLPFLQHPPFLPFPHQEFPPFNPVVFFFFFGGFLLPRCTPGPNSPRNVFVMTTPSPQSFPPTLLFFTPFFLFTIGSLFHIPRIDTFLRLVPFFFSGVTSLFPPFFKSRFFLFPSWS